MANNSVADSDFFMDRKEGEDNERGGRSELNKSAMWNLSTSSVKALNATSSSLKTISKNPTIKFMP